MKSAGRGEPPVEQKEIVNEHKGSIEEPNKEIVQEPTAPELCTRIANAVKAIRSLGGEVEDIDRSSSTDEELQAELEELKNQYKRLKILKECLNKD